MRDDALRLAYKALASAPQSCRFHGIDFTELEAWSGEPRCESCRQPWRVSRALAAVTRELEARGDA